VAPKQRRALSEGAAAAGGLAGGGKRLKCLESASPGEKKAVAKAGLAGRSASGVKPAAAKAAKGPPGKPGPAGPAGPAGPTGSAGPAGPPDPARSSALDGKARLTVEEFCEFTAAGSGVNNALMF